MQPFLLDADTVLRPLTAADAASFHRVIAANQAHLDRWLRWSGEIRSEAEAAAMIALFTDKVAAGDGFHLGLWVQGELVGGSVCWFIHRLHRNAEVGYWLSQRATGRGLATRATTAVLDHLFTHERLHRVEMHCAVDNTASRAVAERLGLSLEGVRRDSHWITDRFRDHAVYGILHSEWAARVGR
jgi:ribosomal-protein-serine acetyltransferase